MSMSLKRYKCPQCDKVSDGTGLKAHMMAQGHEGERTQVEDAPATDRGQFLDQRMTERVKKLQKAATPTTRYTEWGQEQARAQRVKANAKVVRILPFLVVEDENGDRWLMEKLDG